jgi:predicted cupin superfamily sugar epimerase
VTTAADLIALLGLEPHPEGGWYRQTFRDEVSGGRPRSTALYFLLEAHQVSHWHRIDAVEIWHRHAGAPLILSISSEGSEASRARQTLVLGTDFTAGQRPQGIVPAHHWQSARSLGEWTLVGCTVAPPGFEFAGFELAPPGWAPAG